MQTVPHTPNSPQVPPLRVLVADDHDLVRDMIAICLEREGTVEVVTADTLDTALGAVKENGPFDLVLLDYNMPGMNEFEGFRASRP